jgi:transcriptional regulator with XRE-family HTH domain
MQLLLGFSGEAMSQAIAVVEALKRSLKAKKLTYAQVARELKMSEASIKRMFSSHHFTLERFEQVCTIAGLGLTELAREVDSEKNFISHLTFEQEREVVGNAKLFLVAVCALNHMTLEQILASYDIPKSECIQLLLRLDRIKFLELMTNNRIRLKVASNFSWLPNGPILQYFMTRAQQEYFRSRFDGPNEVLMVVNAMLSAASSAQIVAKLRKLANEFSDLHNDDKQLPIGVRRPASVVLALRPWELDDFNKLRRKRRARTAG